MRCKESMFQAFIGAYDEQEAVSAARALCKIGSRAELDTNPQAAKRCHDLIRKPYSAFLNERN
jgi:hypothetical protein